jgi:hypothetical protein
MEVLLHPKPVREDQRKSMSRYRATDVEVLMDYSRMRDRCLLACRMERIRLDELTFSMKNKEIEKSGGTISTSAR